MFRPLFDYRGLVTGLLLMMVAWGLHLPSLRYDFVYYDDVRLLLDHPELYGQTDLSADLREIFVKSFPREEPLPMRDLTWALDSRIFGFGNAFGYHLGNVLLHGIVVGLMFAFLLGTTRRFGFALGATAAYLVLAIHTEPVAWIMGRKDILATLFMLLALCAQTRRLTAHSGPAKCGWYGVALACFAGGLLSKINVLTFPFVLFLHAIFFPYLSGDRPPTAPFMWGRALLREMLLVCPSVALSALVYVWYSRILTQMGILGREAMAQRLGNLWNLMMVDPLVLWVYVQQTFFPWHLSVFYTWPGLRLAYPPWQVMAALATLAGVGGMAVWLFRGRKDLFFYYSAFFILLVPYLSLSYIGFWVAERYLYFSAFCLLALAWSPLLAALRQPKRIIRIGGLVVVVVFLTTNLLQHFWYQGAWKNAETLWQYHISLPNPSSAAYDNLAAYYYAEVTARQGKPQSTVSLRKMEVVVEAGLAEFWRDHQQPPPPETYFLFFLKSIIQEVNGDLEAALASLLTAERLQPRFDSTKLNLARLYRKLAKLAQDPRQRETYACAARDRFAEYVALAFRDRLEPPEVHQEFADLKAECSSLAQPATRTAAPNY